ncbi:MAG TPA: YDG domain-containing protein, partial [Steroidobacteraceae bacterium]
TKIYDATTTATLDPSNYQISGFVAGQSATVNQPSSVGYVAATAGPETLNATLSTTNFVAGSGTKLSNYTLPTTATGTGLVLQAPLILTGVLATNKVYDAGFGDVLDTAHAGIYGLIGGDAVTLSSVGATGTFASRDAGSNLAVGASGFTLGGAQQGNYQLVLPQGLTANITPAPLTITGVSVANKVYDGTTTAALNSGSAALSGILGADGATVLLSSSGALGAFASKNVGAGLAVTSSGFSISGINSADYVLAQVTGLSAAITPAPLSVTLIGNPTKSYNGTTTAALSSSNLSVTGFVAGEGATVPQAALSEYNSANASVQTITVTLTTPDFAVSGGALLSNYTLPTTVTGVGTITPAPLAGMIAGNPTKVYDGAT